MWDVIAATALAEFSDLSDPESLTKVVLRLCLATVLAALVGYERERRGSSAGLRTHMMVALGVSLLVVASEQSGMDRESVSRVIQGVFAGIGFLGAGAIIKQDNKDQVRGLTTAASIWATAGIATAAGLGREGTAILGTVFVLGVLSLALRLERRAMISGR
jgi:putative Mg2+ transporter-C (MgtC) family protein